MEKDKALEKATRLSRKALDEKNAEIVALTKKLEDRDKEVQELRAQESIKTSSLMVGDFAGKWSGSLPRGGTVEFDVRADGRVLWSVPSVGQTVAGVSHIEKSGESYVVNIQNQQVRLYLSSDRRSLRLAGGGLDNTTLNRK
jgi:hypothetical protein